MNKQEKLGKTNTINTMQGESVKMVSRRFDTENQCLCALDIDSFCPRNVRRNED